MPFSAEASSVCGAACASDWPSAAAALRSSTCGVVLGSAGRAAADEVLSSTRRLRGSQAVDSSAELLEACESERILSLARPMKANDLRLRAPWLLLESLPSCSMPPHTSCCGFSDEVLEASSSEGSFARSCPHAVGTGPTPSDRVHGCGAVGVLCLMDGPSPCTK